jgi:hypothetical protein
MRKIFFSVLLLSVLVSCNKKEGNISIAGSDTRFKIENGILSFNSSGAYSNYLENKALRELLLNGTKHKDFNALGAALSSNTNKTAAAETDGPVLDSLLYPEYLMQILNSDKMVEIENCYVKVDLENNRGLITRNTGRKSYSKLKYDEINDPAVIMIPAEGDGIEIIEWLNQGLTKVQINELLQVQRCARANSAEQKEIRAYFIENTIPPYQGRSYVADSKIVYQAAVIYFSLQSKIKTKWQYNSSNWTNPHFADLKLNGTVKFRRRCDGEENNAQNLTALYNNELNWRPYEGPKSLSHFLFRATFLVNDGLRTNYTYINPHGRTFEIKFNY